MITKTSLTTTYFFIISLFFAFPLNSCKKEASPDDSCNSNTMSIPCRIKPSQPLLAHWPFDGNGNDFSGNGNTATLFNVTSTYDRFGNPSGAFYFNGISSYASVADRVALRLNNTDFTLNSWVKLESYGAMILSKRVVGADNGWQTSVSGPASGGPAGVLTYGPGGGSVNAWGNGTVSLNNWHMLTCTYSLSTGVLKVYIDGVLDTSTRGILTANVAITTALNIGRDLSTFGSYLKGAMDDIRIYGSELDASEVQLLYSIPPAPTNGLIAYWPFDEDGQERSGNRATATLFNVRSGSDRFCNPRGALYFNGTSSYASVPDRIPLRLTNTDFTLNSWVNLESYGAMILSKRIIGANNGWQTSVSGPESGGPAGVLTFGPGGGSTNAWGSSRICLNNWHMLTCTYSSSNGVLKVYIDGVLDKGTSGILTPNGAITTELNIGRDLSTLNSYLKGAMDDIRIYNRAITDSEVRQLYNTFD